MPGQYRKHLPKLYLVKENSRLGATALPSMAKVNVGPCFTWQEEKNGRNGRRNREIGVDRVNKAFVHGAPALPTELNGRPG